MSTESSQMDSQKDDWQIPTSELIDAIVTIHAHIMTLRGFLESHGMDQEVYQRAFEVVRARTKRQLTTDASWKNLFRELETN